MPAKKNNFDEIERGIILEIEGKNSIEIAKSLTNEAFEKLYEKEIINTPMTLKLLTQFNEKRNRYYKADDLIKDMQTASPLRQPQIRHIKKAFVTVDRIRRMQKSEIWKNYKKEFQPHYLKLIAQKKAEDYVKKGDVPNENPK